MKLTNPQIIILAGIALCLPLFFVGVKGHDAVNHLIISRLFAEQFFEGNFYPRWLFDAEAGLGSPISSYFPPFGYYICLLFHPLNYLDNLFSLPAGYLALYSSATLAVILSGIFFYKYLSLIIEKRTALFLAIFYMSLPYHLGVDVYYRFAYSELWAFAFIPLCLYFLKRESFTGLTFSISGLLLCHLLTAVIFLPLLAILIILADWRYLLSLPLALALAAFYLLPLTDSASLISSQIGIGTYAIAKNFITVADANGKYFALVGLLCAIPAFLNLKYASTNKALWITVLAASLFMTIGSSNFIWAAIPQLSALSFPWRFLIISSLAAAILLTKTPIRVILYLTIFNIVLSYPLIILKNAEDPDKYLQGNVLTIDDFRPRWVNQQNVIEGDSKSADKLRSFQFSHGVIVTHSANKLIFNSPAAGTITLPQFYFPNWVSEYKLTPEPETGLIQLNLPKPGKFTLTYAKSEAENYGFAISIASLILITLIFGIIRRKNRIYESENQRADSY